jgi:hypothetical protein
LKYIEKVLDEEGNNTSARMVLQVFSPDQAAGNK